MLWRQQEQRQHSLALCPRVSQWPEYGQLLTDTTTSSCRLELRQAQVAEE